MPPVSVVARLVALLSSNTCLIQRRVCFPCPAYPYLPYLVQPCPAMPCSTLPCPALPCRALFSYLLHFCDCSCSTLCGFGGLSAMSCFLHQCGSFCSTNFCADGGHVIPSPPSLVIMRPSPGSLVIPPSLVTPSV